mgnify:CR=1 FL=1
MILAEDLGFSDIAPYGSEINTPSLSALAAAGVSFALVGFIVLANTLCTVADMMTPTSAFGERAAMRCEKENVMQLRSTKPPRTVCNKSSLN